MAKQPQTDGLTHLLARAVGGVFSRVNNVLNTKTWQTEKKRKREKKCEIDLIFEFLKWGKTSFFYPRRRFFFLSFSSFFSLYFFVCSRRENVNCVEFYFSIRAERKEKRKKVVLDL